jgi:hypothetical protein
MFYRAMKVREHELKGSKKEVLKIVCMYGG